MQRPILNTFAGGVAHLAPRKGHDEQRARPRRIADIRFGQVQVVKWRGREFVEVM